MAMTPKVRAFAGLAVAMRALRLIPSPARTARMKLDKRLGIKPPGWAVDPLPASVELHDDALPGGQRVRVYRGVRRGLQPVVLYIHGGGFIVGGLVGSDHICARLAQDAGCAVVAVEYRLAPEHPYPAGLDDTEATLGWVDEHADALSLDPARLVIAGDSAGGNLAAALANRCAANGRAVAGQVLIYPALDATCSTDSARTFKGAGLTHRELVSTWSIYRAQAEAANPEVSPLFAPSLGGLPPTLMLLAGQDALHDEGLQYAKRLQEAGVQVTAIDYPNYLHAFFSLPKLYGGLDESWAALSSFVRATLFV